MSSFTAKILKGDEIRKDESSSFNKDFLMSSILKELNVQSKVELSNVIKFLNSNVEPDFAIETMNMLLKKLDSDKNIILDLAEWKEFVLKYREKIFTEY
jgi:hypothetical protein